MATKALWEWRVVVSADLGQGVRSLHPAAAGMMCNGAYAVLRCADVKPVCPAAVRSPGEAIVLQAPGTSADGQQRHNLMRAETHGTHGRWIARNASHGVIIATADRVLLSSRPFVPCCQTADAHNSPFRTDTSLESPHPAPSLLSLPR